MQTHSRIVIHGKPEVSPARLPTYLAIGAILDAEGIAYRPVFGRKHPSIQFNLGGRRRRIILAGSPSDRRSLVNAVAYVKRLIRQTKAERTDGQ
jgi:hypothetical protein